jgi:NADPH:quinone reductase-like Zn-dependent oxidoreductase
LAKGAYVHATASSDTQDLLRELGISALIDYTTVRFEDVVRDIDVVFDTVGGTLQARSFHVLKPGGIYVTPTGQPDGEAAQARGVRASGMMAQADPAQLREITALIDAGVVKPVVSKVLPLAEAAAAHALLDAGHIRGKIVLRVAG